MIAKAQPFASEAELCAAFIAALPEGWTAYPETADFDILLVRDDALQVGVEAKMRVNAKVIDQAIPSPWSCGVTGPDHRAILVPRGKVGSFRRLCGFLGLMIVEASTESFSPSLPVAAADRWEQRSWHDWCPIQGCAVPGYVPDVPAGVPAPRRLTEWKVKAIKIAVLLERRGQVTRADFRALRIDPGRWTSPVWRWLHIERRGVYVAGQDLPDFKGQHPTNYAQILSDFDKWAPPPHDPPRQLGLL